MNRPLDPYTLAQAAARWPQETLSSRAARSFLLSLEDEARAAQQQQPATVGAPTGLAQRLHDAACGCGESLLDEWSSSYWLTIARAAVAELQQPATVVALSTDPADRERAVERVADVMRRRYLDTPHPNEAGRFLWRELAAAAVTELEQSDGKR